MKNMMVILKRGGEPLEYDRIHVIIGKSEYTLSESIDGKLTINKHSVDGDDAIAVYPGVSNQIHIL